MRLDTELIARQKNASYALVLQGLVLTAMGAILSGIYIISPYTRLEYALFLFFYFGGYGIIPIVLGVVLYRGHYAKDALEGWLAISLILGVFNTGMNLVPSFLLARSRWQPIISVIMVYSLLIPAWMLYRLTTYYSSLLMSAEQREDEIELTT